MMHTICTTKNGRRVSVDLVSSQAAAQISRRPHFLTYVSEALSKATLGVARQAVTHDLGRTIGYDFVVETHDSEAVFYAQITKETIYTPFTKKGEPAATSLLTMVLTYSEADGYILEDLWPGSFRPPRPGDTAATNESQEYWRSHAYIFEDQHLRASSITRECPYE